MHEESGSSNGKKLNLQNLWDTTRKTVQDAIKGVTQPVTCCFQATQKKIELVLLSRTITAAQNDLGKTIDTARASGLANVFENPEVKTALEKLDQLKRDSAKLTEEIASLQKPACASNCNTPKE